MKKQDKKIKANEFDEAFEAGDVVKHLNLKSIKVNFPVHRINIDIPQDILERVDREAARMGVPRTSLLKIWIANQTDRLAG